ncbi:Dihydrofolate reductase [Planctomycetes bacterium MalM25]|nr:Dihydrofolate reductase [Planctomycetes bacterium MalM25]
MIIISAMSDRRVIGAGEGMPWSVPEEYQRYLDTVASSTVIFGRRSYEIFGADLDKSELIVVTRRPAIEGVRTAASLDEALRLAELSPGETFVAGGASLYEQAIALADRMFLSTIRGDYEGDAYFPDFDHSDWRVKRSEEHERYVFREWVRNV